MRRRFGLLTVDAGARLAESTLVADRALDRWLLAEASPRGTWRLHASAGVVHQFPALSHARDWTDPGGLRPESATVVDAGVSHRLPSMLRWGATVFARRERDILFTPSVLHVVSDGVVRLTPFTRSENVLGGSANGIEVTLERFARPGLGGWIGYGFGVARHRDVRSGESFSVDFDQRHAFITSGTAGLWGTQVGFTMRAGTNRPLAGEFTERDGRLFVGGQRNVVRLPPYVRLDVRADRRLARRFTMFAEIINVTAHANVGAAEGVVMHGTGEAIGFRERLLPRLVIGGLRVDLGSTVR